MTTRLRRGQPFFVVQIFDRAGYYSSILATTEVSAQQRTAERTTRLPSLVFCTVPFRGTWAGTIPDVSAPPEHKEATRALEPNGEDA